METEDYTDLEEEFTTVAPKKEEKKHVCKPCPPCKREHQPWYRKYAWAIILLIFLVVMFFLWFFFRRD